jgi:hypothetical protein
MAIRSWLGGAALIFAVGGQALVPPVGATTLTELSTVQMTDASDLVVRATVTEVWAVPDERGQIWTRVQLEVDQTFKGAPVDAIIVDQLGGVYHNDYATILGAARFSPGEEGLFFLETFDSGRTSVVGLFQGKYTIRIDPDSGREMLVRFAPRQEVVYDHRFIPHPPVDERIFFDDLVDGVETRVDLGWDGEPIPGADTNKLRRINKLQDGVQ